VDPGDWTGASITYAYQWERCLVGGACTVVDDTADSTYTLRSSDVGYSLLVDVTAENNNGSSDATTDRTAVVAPPPSPAPVPSLTPLSTTSAAVTSTTSAMLSSTAAASGSSLDALGRLRWGISVGGISVNRGDALRAFELNEIQSVGARFVRFDDTPCNQANVDRYVGEVQTRGMAPFLILGGANPPAAWSSAQAYADWAAGQASRYAPLGVHFFELLNEPNLNGWTAGQYAQAVTLAYPKIKAADPQSLVVVGAVGIGNSARDQFTNFLAPLFPTIAGHYDVFSIHASDDLQAHDWWQMAAWAWGPIDSTITNSVRNLIDQNGDTGKPIMISEYDLGPVPKYSESAETTLLQHALNDSRPLAVAVYTMLNDDVPGFGLLRDDLTPRPAWTTYHTIAAP
jgi:hypothetical protein